MEKTNIIAFISNDGKKKDFKFGNLFFSKLNFNIKMYVKIETNLCVCLLNPSISLQTQILISKS